MICNSCETHAKLSERIEFFMFLQVFQHKTVTYVFHSIQFVRRSMESCDLSKKKWFLGYNGTLHVLFIRRKTEIFRKSFLTHLTAFKPFPTSSSPQKTYRHDESSCETLFSMHFNMRLCFAPMTRDHGYGYSMSAVTGYEFPS